MRQNPAALPLRPDTGVGARVLLAQARTDAAGPLHLLMDSAGIKAEGEGEWSARKRDGLKRRL
jgi:hypothetical protein